MIAGTIKYTLHGKNVVHMTKGSDELHFFYDAQNRPAVVVYNGTAYAYVKNLQGDIIAILDSAGTTVVSYAYDAWGAPTGTTGSMAATLGALNPFRYRSYVFDEETGLYYLRSRYYAPIYVRFINADVIYHQNTFMYCSNSPVLLVDASGYSPTTSQFSVCTLESGGNIPDYSQAVISELENSIAEFSEHSVGNALTMPIPADMVSHFNDYWWFVEQVALKGPWDLKNTWHGKYPSLKKPTHSYRVLFMGELATSEDIGNFAYGFLGSAMGVYPEVLLMAAGAAQHAFRDSHFAGMNFDGFMELMQGVDYAVAHESDYWGDDQNDYKWTTMGISYFHKNYLGQ